MLDETTCPVCGKVLNDERISLTPTDQPLWAVAHYLAHLVQQKQNFGLPDGNWDIHDGIAVQRLDRTVGSP